MISPSGPIVGCRAGGAAPTASSGGSTTGPMAASSSSGPTMSDAVAVSSPSPVGAASMTSSARSAAASSEAIAISSVSCENPTSSKVRDTSAIGAGPRVSEPAKMTSSIALPRRCLALCSPMHQRMASTMFDLPQPLGPTTPVISESSCTTARSQNDLNPMISTRLIRMSSRWLRPVRSPGSRGRVDPPSDNPERSPLADRAGTAARTRLAADPR